MPTAMTGSRVSEYLLSASDDSLCSSLALLHELSLVNLMWSKGADLFGKLDNRVNNGISSVETDHFHQKVVGKSREFAGLSRGERLLQVIGQLQKLMGVSPRDLRSQFDVSEVADDIGTGVVNLLRQDKDAHFT